MCGYSTCAAGIPSSALPHAKHAEYAAGHIPGAVFVDWERDFVDADDPVPIQIAAADAFAARASELGVSDEDLVVTYDDYYGIFAARVAWAFRYHGAESRVLDGGWTTWQDEGRPISTETVDARPATVRGPGQAEAASRAGRHRGSSRPRRAAR